MKGAVHTCRRCNPCARCKVTARAVLWESAHAAKASFLQFISFKDMPFFKKLCAGIQNGNHVKDVTEMKETATSSERRSRRLMFFNRENHPKCCTSFMVIHFFIGFFLLKWLINVTFNLFSLLRIYSSSSGRLYAAKKWSRLAAICLGRIATLLK